MTVDTPEGRVRQVQWQKNVHFEEIVTEWQPNRLLKWRFRFSPDSFPAGALDDHVMIGGQYFDLRDATYTLTPREGGTELRVEVSWRLSTRFNWYADRVMQMLLNDASENILRFYKARSEANGNGGSRMTMQPVFQQALGPAWDRLGDVIRRHYTMTPFSGDYVCVRGTMNEVWHAPGPRC